MPITKFNHLLLRSVYNDYYWNSHHDILHLSIEYVVESMMFQFKQHIASVFRSFYPKKNMVLSILDPFLVHFSMLALDSEE